MYIHAENFKYMTKMCEFTWQKKKVKYVDRLYYIIYEGWLSKIIKNIKLELFNLIPYVF